MGADSALVAGTIGGLTHDQTPETSKFYYARESGKTIPALEIGQVS
jgi:hypothetical protein